MSERVKYLLRQLGLHLLLEPPQQEGPEHLVETADDQDGLLLVQVHLGWGERRGRGKRRGGEEGEEPTICHHEQRLRRQITATLKSLIGIGTTMVPLEKGLQRYLHSGPLNLILGYH